MPGVAGGPPGARAGACATAPTQVAGCLGTDERPLAIVVGTVYPRGWRSAAILLTLGLASLYWRVASSRRRWRAGRHRLAGALRGSRSGELLVDQPLGAVRVDRWGTGNVQKRFTMRVRLSDGTGIRFVAPTGEDTGALTRAAVVLASTSPEPPRGARSLLGALRDRLSSFRQQGRSG